MYFTRYCYRYWAKILRRLLQLLEHLGFLSCNATPKSALPTSIESSSSSSSSSSTSPLAHDTTAPTNTADTNYVNTSAYQCSVTTEASQRQHFASLIDHHATHGHVYTLQPYVDTPLDVSSSAAATTTPEASEVSAPLRFSVHDPASLEAWWGLLRAASLDPAASARAKSLRDQSMLPGDGASPRTARAAAANAESETLSATVPPAPAVLENVHQLSTRLVRALPEITQYLTWRVDNTRAKRNLPTYAQRKGQVDSNDSATKKKRRTSTRSSSGLSSEKRKGAKRQRKTAASKKRDSEKRWYVSSDESYSDSDKDDEEEEEDEDEDDDSDEEEPVGLAQGRRKSSRTASQRRAPSRTGLRNPSRVAVSVQRQDKLARAPVPESDEDYDDKDVNDEEEEEVDSAWGDDYGSKFGERGVEEGQESDDGNNDNEDVEEDGLVGGNQGGTPSEVQGPKKRRPHWWCQQQRALGLFPKMKTTRKRPYSKDPTALWLHSSAHTAKDSMSQTMVSSDSLPGDDAFKEAANLEPIELAAASAVLQVAVYNRHLAKGATAQNPATAVAAPAQPANIATAAVAVAMRHLSSLPERSLRAAYEALLSRGWVARTLPGPLGASIAAIIVHGAGKVPTATTYNEDSSSSSDSSNSSGSSSSSSSRESGSSSSALPLLGEAFESSILSLACCCMASDLYWQLSGAPWRGIGRAGTQAWSSGAYYEADMLPPKLLSSIRTAAEVYAKRSDESISADTNGGNNNREQEEASLSAIACAKMGGYAAWACDTFTGGTTRLHASITTSDQASAPVRQPQQQSEFIPAQAYRGGIAPEVLNSSSTSSSSTGGGGGGGGRTSPSSGTPMPFAGPKQKGVTLEGKAFFEAQRLKLAAKAEADLFLVPELNQIVVDIGRTGQDQGRSVLDHSAGREEEADDGEVIEAQQEATLLQHIAPPWLSNVPSNGYSASVGAAVSPMAAVPHGNPKQERTPLERHLRRSMVAIGLRRPGLPLTALCAPTQGVCTLLPASAAALLHGLLQDGICWLRPMNVSSARERSEEEQPKAHGIFDREEWDCVDGNGEDSDESEEEDEYNDISRTRISEKPAGVHLGSRIRTVRLHDLLAALKCLPHGAPLPRKADSALVPGRPLCVFLAPGGLVRLADVDGDEIEEVGEEMDDGA